jgi:hypothetical protein
VPDTVGLRRAVVVFMSVFFDELQLDLEIALSAVSTKIQPHGQLSPAEDALKRRMT